ncbi:unnamed protein product [Rhizoctonia solani]|uniref:Uncharacterized protein n=1 Tax=Rhizoctonia solani TaxID=456999 RepID=A0A8H2ZX82_9AGAM|nr:unnamed protein product [Rhizoctonia solani]
MSSMATSITQLVPLPVVSEMVEGFQAYQNMGSNREALIKLEEDLSMMSEKFIPDPQRVNTDPEYARFVKYFVDIRSKVKKELQVPMVRRFDAASRLEDFREDLTNLMQTAIKAGYLIWPKVNILDEFDSTIKKLKIVGESNGLVIGELIGSRRYDGTSLSEVRDGLHVFTYQAMYNDAPVEVENYCGGEDDYLIQTVTELVDNYGRRGLNPVLQRLHGGMVFKDQSGQLHAYLVLSPREGTPWVKLVNAKRSVELLCQIAEKSSTVFSQLKQDKQMNFDDIHVRSDGSLLLVPHTEGEKFLHDEDVFDPLLHDKNEVGWPVKELFILLHEACKQGLVRDAVSALREHDGAWDEIAVWRIAIDIGLRPSPTETIFRSYPPDKFTTYPGAITYFRDSPDEYGEWFDLVDKLPEIELSWYEQEHLESFEMISAIGRVGDEVFSFVKQDAIDRWLPPAQHDGWEYFPLEPWQSLEFVSLSYDSARLEQVLWEEWRDHLKKLAREKHLRKEYLGVVTFANVLIELNRKDVPELGTRPVYFHRRKLSADTTPEQFWGFFSFNQDPFGPTGLTVRLSGESSLKGRIVSESLPPDPPDYKQRFKTFEIEIQCVNMDDDWEVLIRRKQKEDRANNPKMRYSDQVLQSSEPDWEMGDE